SPSQTALEGRGMLVSSRQLSVPDKAWRKYQEARLRLMKQDIARARESLNKALEYEPQFAAAWNMLGVISYQERDFPRSEEYFRRAVAADPQLFEALVNLGGVLLNLSKWQDALSFNQKAQTARPQDPLANAQLGLVYFQMGDSERAEKFLSTA